MDIKTIEIKVGDKIYNKLINCASEANLSIEELALLRLVETIEEDVKIEPKIIYLDNEELSTDKTKYETPIDVVIRLGYEAMRYKALCHYVASSCRDLAITHKEGGSLYYPVKHPRVKQAVQNYYEMFC